MVTVFTLIVMALMVLVCWLNDRKLKRDRRERVEQRGVVRSKPRPYDWTAER